MSDKELDSRLRGNDGIVDDMDTMDGNGLNGQSPTGAVQQDQNPTLHRSPYNPKADVKEERGLRIDNGKPYVMQKHEEHPGQSGAVNLPIDFMEMKPIIESLITFENDITQFAGLIKGLYSKYYQPGMINNQAYHLKDEVNELMRAIDAGKTNCGKFSAVLNQDEYSEHCKDTVQDEITDVLIMTLGLASYYKMDIESWLLQKMNFNLQRGNHR